MGFKFVVTELVGFRSGGTPVEQTTEAEFAEHPDGCGGALMQVELALLDLQRSWNHSRPTAEDMAEYHRLKLRRSQLLRERREREGLRVSLLPLRECRGADQWYLP